MGVQVTIQERLKEMSEALNIRQIDIVNKTGIDKVTISLYFSGRRVPKQENIMLIADAFSVDPAWLMGYDVPMIRKKVFSDSEFSFLLDIINEDASYFVPAIEALRNVPAEHREVVLGMLKGAGK